MGPEESPLSNGAGIADIQTRAELARELTAVRTRAALTVRSLAQRLDVPTATVGGYFSGRHLPGPSQLAMYRAILRECGVAEPEVQDWIDALARVRLASDRRVGRVEAPYRGLEPFEVDDAELFFGREAVTEEVLTRLRTLRDVPETGAQAGVLIVIGSSGSGKSSLLRAGVAATVRGGALDARGELWSAAIVVPGEAPCAALRASLDELPGQRQLVIIDQLEEIFGAASGERERFLGELARHTRAGGLVIAGLRADFYEAALGEPLLLAALAHNQLPLGAMSEGAIRRVILEPARRLGAVVEPGLADLLLADLAPRGQPGVAHGPGALPLLSHALLATWNSARGNEMTIADYRAAGGLRSAVSQTAEQVYEQLSSQDREQARRIFSRLVRVNEEGPLTRRRVARNELDELDPSGSGVLDRFIAARLLTAGIDTIELSHEELITAWPRLADWIANDRADRRVRHQITDGTRAWEDGGREPSLLFRGSRLETSADWAHDPDNRGQLTASEAQFLDASVGLAERERRDARRRAQQMQRLLVALGGLVVIAGVLVVLAVRASRSADSARNQALSRQVAIEADTLEPTDPSLAMQLALIAYRKTPTLQSTSALLGVTATEMPTRILGVGGPTSEALSGDGRELALADSAADHVTLYRMATTARPRPLATVSAGAAGQQLYALALSPNGRLLAAGGTAGQVTLWNLAAPAHPVRIATLTGFTSTIYAIAFSPDSRRLAAADHDGTVLQWTLAPSGDSVAQTILTAPGRPSLQALAYAPNGRTLAAAGANGTLYVWGVGAGTRPLASLLVAANPLTSVAYSPDGHTLVAGAQSSLIYVFDASADGTPSVEHAPLRGFTNYVNSLAFSADGRYLAAGSSDGTARIWSTAGWTHVATLAHPAQVTGVLFTPDGRHLLTVDEDGTARVWSLPPPTSIVEPGGVYTIDYSANGDLLAAVSGGSAGGVDLWNTSDPWRPAHLAAVGMGSTFGPAAGVEALSPSGTLLAVGNPSGIVRLVNLTDPRRPRPFGPDLTGATPYAEQLNFSPNMKQLSIADATGRIHLWDINAPAHPALQAIIDPKGTTGSVLGVAYSPNGRLLAAASNDGKVRLWDVVSNPSAPHLLSVLGGFRNYASTVAFTPDGRTLAAGSEDDTVRLWNVSDPAHPVALDQPLTASTSPIYDLDVDPTGTILAAATTGHDVLLWNIRDPSHPTLIADLTAATGNLYDVTFSPNGDTLAASGADQILHFWNYHPAKVADQICSLAGTPITRAEWSQYIQGTAYDPPCSETAR